MPGERHLCLPPWHPAVVVATWFGAGLLPITPGSWGSLAALPVAWAIEHFWGAPGLAIAAAIVFLAGWWAAATVAKASGIADPGAIVVDEVAAQWLVLLAASRDPVGLGARLCAVPHLRHLEAVAGALG